MSRPLPVLPLPLLPLVLLGLASCAPPGEFEIGEQHPAVTVPPKGSATTLDVASWNLDWFGDTQNGPANETLQLDNARDVISGTDFDIWGVEEIVGLNQFNNLKSQIGYAGFLANDPIVQNGAAYYSDFNNLEQKVGILYKSELASVRSAKVILTQYDFDFAGRPPMEVTLRVTLNGRTEDLVVIVLHAKCCSDSDSWQRRQNAANALKSYLDNTYPTQKVLVIGDFNDDLDTSITPGELSPYQSFVNDATRYTFPTKALTDAGISTEIGYPDAIDHHLNTNEMNATYVAGSAEAYRVDQYVPSYGTTTSDHYPVLTRYNWAGGSPTAQVILNEILANEPGSSTAGEAIEIVNTGSAAVDIRGWTLSDSIQVRHTFAAGTILAAGKAIVVFGAASAIPPGLTNAVASSTGKLSLNNGGDTVTLRDGAGAIQDGFAYPSSLAGTDGVSMNRNPDGSASGSFVLHTAISSLQRSPGTRADGSAW
jgi:endonuclease/exonuclease/phosphatase family metal-dependent hydrolase